MLPSNLCGLFVLYAIWRVDLFSSFYAHMMCHHHHEKLRQSFYTIPQNFCTN